MLPFSTLSRRPGKDLFFQIAKLLNPELSEQLPTAYKMSERNLSAYYDSMLNRVKCSITSAFNSSYGTLLFDGWTDISNESVVNVLLSITGVERVRKTFFLRSIYTGSRKCGAQFYASALEEVMGSFGSMVNICAVVSDNTSCCVKAKQLLIDKHNHLLSCQDQTHVANLLMQDLGSVKWISGILQKVTSIFSELRRHPKLYHRFKELKDQHNLSLLADASHQDALQGAVDHYGRPALPRPAVLPCRMATTRFASSESMLRSVLRSEKVYHRLIECPDFESTLYGARGARGLEKRREFQSLIQDRALMRDALDVSHILRLVRQYLLLFEDESSLISEVFPATRELRYRISVLPLTAFFTTDRRDEVLSVFDERLRGSTRRIPLLTPLHRVAFYLDIRSTYQDISEDREHVSQMMRDFVRSDVFPIAEKAQDRGGEDRAVQLLLQELSLLRLSWRSCGTDDTRRNLLWCYSDIPLVYWIEYDDKRSLLREFALRILGTSPSSSSVERSFSHQGRIRTSVRNRLNQQKVMRMVFCSFNDLLFSERSLRIEQVAKREYQNIRFGGWNRSMNTTLTSSLTTTSNVTGESNLFEEFFGYEDGADGDIEEIEEVEVDDVDVDQDGLAPTSEVMDFFG